MTKKDAGDNKREWYIGLDFGSSNSCVLFYDAVSNELLSSSVIVDIGDKYSLNIPTKMTYGEEENILIGQKAVQESKSHYILECLKKALRRCTPEKLKGEPYKSADADEISMFATSQDTVQFGSSGTPKTIKAIAIDFFRELFQNDEAKKQKLNIGSATIKKIVIGKPIAEDITSGSSESVDYETDLREVMETTFGLLNRRVGETGIAFDKRKNETIQITSEPELAGRAYLHSENPNEEKKVLVIDIGGGTTDFSILNYTGDGKIQPYNIGSSEYAGNTVDYLISELIYLYQEKKLSTMECAELKHNLFAKTTKDDITNDIVISPLSIDEIKPKTVPKTNIMITYSSAGFSVPGKFICLDDGHEYTVTYDKDTCKWKHMPSDKCGDYTFVDTKNDAYICLEDGYRYNKDGEREKIKSKDGSLSCDLPPLTLNGVFKKIFDDFNEKLKSLTDETKKAIAGINTVLFMGGSSIITPLRKYLIDKIKELTLTIGEKGKENTKEILLCGFKNSWFDSCKFEQAINQARDSIKDDYTDTLEKIKAIIKTLKCEINTFFPTKVCLDTEEEQELFFHMKTFLEKIEKCNEKNDIQEIRDSMDKLYNEFQSFCKENMHLSIITMFGKDAKRMTVGLGRYDDGDKDGMKALTCYTAVAAGALLEALGGVARVLPEKISFRTMDGYCHEISTGGNMFMPLTETYRTFAQFEISKETLITLHTVNKFLTISGVGEEEGNTFYFYIDIDGQQRSFAIHDITGVGDIKIKLQCSNKDNNIHIAVDGVDENNWNEIEEVKK